MTNIILNRPAVICHMMMTIDGKIASGESTDILDEYFGLYTKTEDMLPTHTAWMCGRVTMQMFAAKNEAFVYNASKPTRYMFGVDTKGMLKWGGNTIKLSNIEAPLHLVIVVTESTPKEYVQYLNDKKILYVVAGKDDIDFNKLLTIMEDTFNVKNLLLEGGGILNGSAMDADFVDEISVLLTPIVLSKSSAPSLFEHNAVNNIQIKKFTVKSVQQLESDCIWIRYARI